MKLIKKQIDNLKRIRMTQWWYILLLIAGSVYTWTYRNDINQVSELNAQNLIFILWLALLFFPLFSELEIGGVKVRKELEKTREEVKDSIGELKYQILDMKVFNANSNTFVVNNQPLPSKDELSAMKEVDVYDTSNVASMEHLFKTPEENIYLFQVRLSIEQQLAALCKLFQYEERRTVYSLVNFLVRKEVLDFKTANLIREVNNIANHGVHGEIVDDEYIRFVKESYPIIHKSLEKLYSFHSNGKYYFECPKCKFSGPSKFLNKCPNCRTVTDNE